MNDVDAAPVECGLPGHGGRCYLRPEHYGDHLYSSRPFPSRPDWDPVQGKEYVSAWNRRQLARAPRAKRRRGK